jgi:ATP-dependent DNA ligase
VIIYSRNRHDFTELFASIAHELPSKAAVLDGEVVASDAVMLPDGSSNYCRRMRVL